MSNYIEDPAVYDIEVERGRTEVVPFYGWEKDDEPWDLAGLDIRMDIKESEDICRYPNVSLTVGNGLEVDGNNLVVTIQGEDTAKLLSGVYYYDIVIGDLSYIRGKVKPTGRVTK